MQSATYEALEVCAAIPEEHLRFLSPLERRIVRASRMMLDEEIQEAI